MKKRNLKHVYADTWAHRGFTGTLSEKNNIKKLRSADDNLDSIFSSILFEIMEGFVPPLGHGQAGVLPDLPFIKWRYTDHKGEEVYRNNPGDFFTAACEMCKMLRRYRIGDIEADVPDVECLSDKAMLKALIPLSKNKSGKERHKKWIAAISAGAFSFGLERPIYDADGKQSWKFRALNTTRSRKTYEYDNSFLRSDWKLFHDASQEYQLMVIHDVLPRYQICVS